MDDENAIERADVGFASSIDPHAHGLDAAFGGTHNLDVGCVCDLHNGFRVYNEIGGAVEGVLTEGENAHAGIFYADGAFVVGPALLSPKLNTVGTSGWIAQAFSVVHPDARFTGLLHVGGADFQGTEQAKL